MNSARADIERFERRIFTKSKPLERLLSFGFDLMSARQAGLLYGTDRSGRMYLPPARWDRGVMHKFVGKGLQGAVLKHLGTLIVRAKGLSPVHMYKESYLGERMNQDGIIPFVLRKHQDFYRQGIKIIIIKDIPFIEDELCEQFSKVHVYSYDGRRFNCLANLKINSTIARQFKAENFISAYIPDYGAIVFNTIPSPLLETSEAGELSSNQLKIRLDCLISAIEMASLANLGYARGRQAAHIIWRKEKKLRETAKALENKQSELEAQKSYLRAVGAVNARQLNMQAVNISDGVYAFLDMVGSATIRKSFNPRDYFFILNLCHQVAADNANQYACRVDNFIGDSVFLQNISVFDSDLESPFMGPDERAMLTVMAIAGIFNDLERLKSGCHPLDKDGRMKDLIQRSGVDLDFRAGVDTGPAMVGPLGSASRKIVTAVGKAVNNASRLESSGVPRKIHISEPLYLLLKRAYISKETQVIWKTLSDHKRCTEKKIACNSPFMNAYATVFDLGKEFVEDRHNVAFKEFSRKISYLISALPEPMH